MKKFLFNIILNARKGHRKLVKLKKLSIIRKILSDLKNEILIKNQETFFKISKDKILRQFLTQKLLSAKFAFAFFYFFKKKKKIIYPLPYNWVKSLDANGYKVNLLLSIFIYIFYSMFLFFKGFSLFFFIVLKIINNFIFNKNKKFDIQKSTIFMNLNTKKITLDSNQNFTFYKWYKKYISTNEKIVFYDKKNKNTIYSKELFETNDFFGLFIDHLNLKDFILNFIKLILNFRKLSLLQYNLVLFDENIKYIFFKSIKDLDINKIYFIWANNTFRPLWTYELQNRNTEIIIFFNGFLNEIRTSSDLKLAEDYLGFSNMTWPKYYSWDKNTSEFLRQIISKKIEIIQTGPIYLKDINKNLNINKKTIAAFGYENHKKNLGLTTNADYTLSNSNFIKYFYYDIYEYARLKGYNLLVKRKNNLGNLEIKKNKIFFEKFSKLEGVEIIDSDISPFRIIHKCDIIISMPFTSTAGIGQYLKKDKNAYYDPIKWIQPNDPSSSNVKLISGKDELFKW